MANFEPKPEGMSYAEWLKNKGIAVRVKMAIHTDTGIPYEFRNRNVPELFERNLDRQGGRKIDPEDM